MTTPVPDADAAEQRLAVDGYSDDGALHRAAVPDDASEADAVEQAQPVGAAAARPLSADLPLEADPADAAEQDDVVPLDEDEGRR